jgi:hypothetical protein
MGLRGAERSAMTLPAQTQVQVQRILDAAAQRIAAESLKNVEAATAPNGDRLLKLGTGAARHGFKQA